MKPLTLLLAAGAMLVMIGCKNPILNNTKTPIPTTVAVTADDNGKTVTVAAGGTITATVAANPTTGYQWTVPTLPNNIKLVNSEYKGPSSPAMGAGGSMVFTFQATDTGISPVRLVYARSFAPQDKPIYLTFTVVVKPQIKPGVFDNNGPSSDTPPGTKPE